MSQHLIKEVQQLKHEVRMLKEGPEHRDMGVEVDDLLEWVKGLDSRLEVIERELNIPASPELG
tara:strand:- start:158 stop:346 length:189 start_codon:yes stop_codon:yes gene_type:complete